MNTKTLSMFLIGLILLAGCASSAAQATPTLSATPTLFFPTQTTSPLSLTPGAVTPAPGTTVVAPPGPSTICNDPQVTALIDSFKKAVLNSDGPLLSSLVSPSRSMDVAFFRDGTVITYDQDHAKFLFETTFQVDWGAEPGSGAPKKGSFHDVVVPELVKIFNQPYTLKCNEIQHGGASYEIKWPYQGEYYSIYFPGTQANGNMDWHTWVIGIEYVNGKPYIYALMQFFWEP
ncbi:MAG TPA: hypothetical protein VK206_27855 [Anaerolineales bacterium]|nr:hypothetical protein [Anaerolineales bacterium]